MNNEELNNNEEEYFKKERNIIIDFSGKSALLDYQRKNIDLKIPEEIMEESDQNIDIEDKTEIKVNNSLNNSEFGKPLL